MHPLTGKFPVIDKEKGKFLDLGGVFPPIFQ